MGELPAPPLPGFEVLDLPDDEINVAFVQRDCNYLQALEGDIDTSHFGFLHAGHVNIDDVPEDQPLRNTIVNRAPEYHGTRSGVGIEFAALAFFHQINTNMVCASSSGTQARACM